MSTVLELGVSANTGGKGGDRGRGKVKGQRGGWGKPFLSEAVAYPIPASCKRGQTIMTDAGLFARAQDSFF